MLAFASFFPSSTPSFTGTHSAPGSRISPLQPHISVLYSAPTAFVANTCKKSRLSSTPNSPHHRAQPLIPTTMTTTTTHASSAPLPTPSPSPADQTACFTRNDGIWEGNLSKYAADLADPSNPDSSPSNTSLLKSVEPTMLFVDVEKYGENNAVSAFNLALRMPTRNKDAMQYHSVDKGYASKGMVFDHNGNMCSGTKDSRRGIIVEHNINHWDDSNTSILGRLRVVVMYRKDNWQLYGFTAYREVPAQRLWGDLAARKQERDKKPEDSIVTPLYHDAKRVGENGVPGVDDASSVIAAIQGEWHGVATIVKSDAHTYHQIRSKTIIKATNPEMSQIQTCIMAEIDGSFKELAKGSAVILDHCTVQFENDMVMKTLGTGVTVLTPKRVPTYGTPFFVELGWLHSPHTRYRITRTYNSQGDWTQSTFIKENKVA